MIVLLRRCGATRMSAAYSGVVLSRVLYAALNALLMVYDYDLLPTRLNVPRAMMVILRGGASEAGGEKSNRDDDYHDSLVKSAVGVVNFTRSACLQLTTWLSLSIFIAVWCSTWTLVMDWTELWTDYEYWYYSWTQMRMRMLLVVLMILDSEESDSLLSPT